MREEGIDNKQLIVAIQELEKEKCRKRRKNGTNNHNDETVQILRKWICEK